MSQDSFTFLSSAAKVKRLREQAKIRSDKYVPEFQTGQIVRTDEGNLAIIVKPEEQAGSTPDVLWIDDDGEVHGPVFGYECFSVNSSEYRE